MVISKSLQAAIRAHAAESYPQEACGLLIRAAGGREYVPCENVASTPSEHFVMSHHDATAAEDRGEVLAIIHSHPDKAPTPSMADRVSCELHGLPWGIVSWPDGEFDWFKPSGYTAPLLGREFAHGLLDCLTAIRDWYAREAGIEIPNFERRDLWWEDKDGPSLYVQHYEEAGFYRVDTPRRGDVLVMAIPSPGRPCYHPNHGAVYLGSDPSLLSEDAPALGGAGPFIYHHLYGRLAAREPYGFSYATRTQLILRHKDYQP